MNRLTTISPQDIEQESFRIIEDEFYRQTGREPDEFDRDTFRVIRRVIHATGDFSFAHDLNFHAGAIHRGIDAIRAGRNIYCDVTMAASGINMKMLSRHGGTVICRINDPKIAEEAQRAGKTRTETAIAKVQHENIGIISIGNAPTALVKAMQMIEAQEIEPDLLVGVPVGFVNAAESKEILLEKKYPFITCKGRKGGTPVAVAIINALIRLAD
ncbi:MAG: precorrin-8X methylmutase [Desulfocapsaceae bacterium]|nr:precorrin-8X methylmutase [Desulfocapsaceae bacterium]